MNILVTGGAGYIGSHVVKQLGESTNANVTVLDNFSTGHKEAVLFGNVVEMELSDFQRVQNFLNNGNFDVVIHFAASIIVPESVENPLKYYLNNTVNTTNLIDASVKSGVRKFIFSSTAAVYGEPDSETVREDMSTNPINPYGMSKLMSETVLRDASLAHKDFKHVILRYFNVAGADTKNRIGQSFPNATHLIKVAAETALRKRKSISIFGTDFDTPDGTGIRDYIHVDDLASAHLEAIKYLDKYDSNTFNCGYGRGYSVKEVLNTMKKVSGVDFNVIETGRRSGDPGTLIANNAKILKHTHWKPHYDNLELICKTALEWEKKLK